MAIDTKVKKALLKRDISWLRSDIEFEKGCLKTYRECYCKHKKQCDKINCSTCVLFDGVIRNSEKLLSEYKKKLREMLRKGI